jgi:hypothetical protein
METDEDFGPTLTLKGFFFCSFCYFRVPIVDGSVLDQIPNIQAHLPIIHRNKITFTLKKIEKRDMQATRTPSKELIKSLHTYPALLGGLSR